MTTPVRTGLVRLALIEGAVIAVGSALVGLVGAAACLIDPQVIAASLLPPAH